MSECFSHLLVVSGQSVPFDNARNGCGVIARIAAVTAECDITDLLAVTFLKGCFFVISIVDHFQISDRSALQAGIAGSAAIDPPVVKPGTMLTKRAFCDSLPQTYAGKYSVFIIIIGTVSGDFVGTT